MDRSLIVEVSSHDALMAGGPLPPLKAQARHFRRTGTFQRSHYRVKEHTA